ELNIIKNVEFSLTTSGRGGENIKVNHNKLSRSFESLYKSSILNYESYITRNIEYQQPSYLFIYPNNDDVEENLQTLVDWKHKKGFEVVAVSTAETGTSLEDIKSYLQDAYDNWENRPEFVCLVGDAVGTFNIPTAFLDGGEGDHYYSLLEGDDILADVIIGRFSIESYFHLQTIISKILSYERSPYMGETDWFTNALLSADPSYSSPSTVITCHAIKELILYHNPDYTFDEVYSPPFASQMNSSLNNGACYFVYRGQWGMNDWTPYGHSNGQKLFTAIIITCGTGDFYAGTSTSESLLRLGSPASPQGAIAAIGTTGPHTHTSFNNIITAGIFDCIFNEDIYYIGSALVRGKLLMYLNYPQNPANHVHQFCYWNNLMGDPGIEIWTDIPQVMEVIYEEQIALGTNYLEVNVSDETGLPLPGAWVTALMGDDVIFSTDFTDVNGSVLLPINTDSTGVVDLTVTKHNFIPHEGTFEIIQSNINISVQDYLIDDDIYGTSSGNNDGFINPGEDIEFSVGLHNFGSVSANNVIAEISSESEYINIIDDVEYYGTIPQGITAVSEDDFDFSVEPYALGGSEFRLDLEIEDDLSNIFHDFIYLYVSGPNLTVFEHTVHDGMNGQLDPGETSVLVVTVENNGTTSVIDVYGTVSCSNNLLTFEDSTGFFGDIAPGTQNNNNSDIFIVTANSQVLPGTQFMVELMLYNYSGYEQVVSFILEVGTVT
ncbi:MAG: hypothetical protein KAT74_12350, partial [Candidatus Cloacimonetes bacterium]|nr:hypothetical protein [Candidatus Cloacimonadota bacterium]